MKKEILISLASALVIGGVWLLFSFFNTNEKVVVVDSQKVLEEYQGFMEAKDFYEIKVKDLSETFNENRKIHTHRTPRGHRDYRDPRQYAVTGIECGS